MVTPNFPLGVPPQLPPGEVHLWLCQTHEWEAHLPALAATLSAEERERINRYRQATDRANMTIGRGVLRQLLAALCGRPANQFEFGVAALGKPQLVGPEARLQFNISHTEGIVAIALAADIRVGVDVEFWRDGIDFEGLARRYFSDVESQLVASIEPRMRRETFFQIWTRKEAYLKALGSGLSQPLDQFRIIETETLSIPPRIRVHPNSTFNEPWTVESVSLPDGYSAAVAAEGDTWRLVRHG